MNTASSMNDILLTWYQGLQLLALGPCLFIMIFLCLVGRKITQVLAPVLFFLTLSAGFLRPLSEALGMSDAMRGTLLLIAGAEAAMSFLLIVQFMTGRAPSLIFWVILAVPLIGGGPMGYVEAIEQGEICIRDICAEPRIFHRLYNIFSISFTSLLTIVIYRRLDQARLESVPLQARRRYALVLSLVALNLLILVIDFLNLTGYADLDHARFAKTVVHIGFIYIAMTLIFRLYGEGVDLAYERIPHVAPTRLSEKDLALAEQIRQLLTQEKIYRDMELSREKLARKLAVTETNLSRVVNQCFHENVTMLVNQYRVEEAKKRLSGETTPITAIAFDVGFSSIPSFNRVFRQFCDMSPSTWRSLHSGRA